MEYAMKRDCPNSVPDWGGIMVVNLLDSWRGMMHAGFDAKQATDYALSHTTAGHGAIAEFLRVSNIDLAEKLLVQTQSKFQVMTGREHPEGYCILQRAQYHINAQRIGL